MFSQPWLHTGTSSFPQILIPRPLTQKFWSKCSEVKFGHGFSLECSQMTLMGNRGQEMLLRGICANQNWTQPRLLPLITYLFFDNTLTIQDSWNSQPRNEKMGCTPVQGSHHPEASPQTCFSAWVFPGWSNSQSYKACTNDVANV